MASHFLTERPHSRVQFTGNEISDEEIARDKERLAVVMPPLAAAVLAWVAEHDAWKEAKDRSEWTKAGLAKSRMRELETAMIDMIESVGFAIGSSVDVGGWRVSLDPVSESRYRAVLSRQAAKGRRRRHRDRRHHVAAQRRRP